MRCEQLGDGLTLMSHDPSFVGELDHVIYTF